MKLYLLRVYVINIQIDMRTTTQKLHKITLFQFKDFEMDCFISKYLFRINQHEVIDEETISVFTPAKYKLTRQREGARSEDIIKNKCQYLQDAIIRSTFREEGSFTISLNAQLLQAVIGKEYKPYLETLTDMGYIELGDGRWGADYEQYYKVGEYSTLYTVLTDKFIKTKPFVNQAIQAYKEKTQQGIQKLKKTTLDYISQLYGDRFIKKYLSSLNLITIEDEEGYETSISKKIAENPNSQCYYEYITEELYRKDKTISKIDSSHRMYHILTNLDRDLKQYLTIDFSIDCKNSHPLLFNYIIFNSLNIPYKSSYNISISIRSLNISSSPNNILHNVGKYLRKYLIYNKIETEDIAKMSDDELEYIYMTSKGLLWDDICKLHPNLDRHEVKEAMFGAVFYSRSPVPDRWNAYAKEFKEKYPSVYRLIGDWKRAKKQDAVKKYMREHHLPTNKGTTSLSIAMMALESEIFTSILKNLYAKRWNAVHIHDCIAIPKDGNKNHPSRDQVVSVMEKVYQEFGLSPTFD